MDNIYIRQYGLFNPESEHDDHRLHAVWTNNVMVYNTIHDICDILSAEYIPYMDLEFKLDDRNYRIPYYNGIAVNAIRVPPSQIYNYISSFALILDNDIICGENIQELADVVLGNPSSLGFNPNNPAYSKNMRTIQSIQLLHGYTSVFVFTHDFPDFYSKFGGQLTNKIVISHNSDHGITEANAEPKLHMGQNCFVLAKNLLPIPIGIENRQWFDHSIFHRVRKCNTTVQKTKDIYFYFSLHTHPSRHTCYNELKNILEWNIPRSKEDYFTELARHKYAICPRGNGLDTHRIWECLYLNVIPIVLAEDFPNTQNLPIIILNNWKEIHNINDHIFTKQRTETLAIPYYRKKIQDNM